MRIAPAKIVVCLMVLGLALSGFGIACNGGESPTESAGTPDVAETATPDPTVSAMMEGVEVDKSVPPTVRG